MRLTCKRWVCRMFCHLRYNIKSSFPSAASLKAQCYWNCRVADFRCSTSYRVVSKRIAPVSSTFRSTSLALQESVLSVRKVIFSSEVIRWQCQWGTSSETAIVPALDLFASLRSRLKINELVPFNEILSSIIAKVPANVDSSDFPDLITCWQRIVADFSHRTLTHSTDRLAAIDGLAQILARDTGFTYMAGLWKEF